MKHDHHFESYITPQFMPQNSSPLPFSYILLQDYCPGRLHSRLCRSVPCLQRMVSQRISCTPTNGGPWKVPSLLICPAPLQVGRNSFCFAVITHSIASVIYVRFYPEFLLMLYIIRAVIGKCLSHCRLSYVHINH